MDREGFMNIVYDLLSNDPDNNRANEIIDAADQYAEDIVKDAMEKCFFVLKNDLESFCFIAFLF